MALIYIVEDDENIREIETIALQNSGHSVAAFGNAADFYRQIESALPDFVLLDIMLPDEDGNGIVKKLRNNPETRKLPVIMVTAKTTEIDLIKGLENGADDYIRKPFSVMELITRVKTLLRRCSEERDSVVQLRDIVLDDSRHRCTVCDEAVELTFKEFELLKYLIRNKGIVLSREQMMLAVWGTDFEGESRTVDMHIKTLRQKLGSAGEYIRTVRNVGYVIE